MATTLSFRVHYLNLQPNAMLSAAIERGLALLAPHRLQIAHCDVHVGRWVQHHNLGSSYRVILELDPQPGALPVSIECESALNAAYPALLKLVQEAFARAARRLTARAQHADEPSISLVSPEALRLHPLHGLPAEERQFCAGDE